MLDILVNVIGPVAVVAFVGFFSSAPGEPFDPATYCHDPHDLYQDPLPDHRFARDSCRLRAEAVAPAHRPRSPSLSSFLLAPSQQLRCTWSLSHASRTSTCLPPSPSPDCGNIGLPLALFAFGKDGLALAIAYLAVTACSTSSSGRRSGGKVLVRETLFSPLLWATALGDLERDRERICPCRSAAPRTSSAA